MMREEGETKQLSMCGLTAVATMDGETLGRQVSGWMTRQLKKAEEVGSDGRPTAGALAAVQRVDDYMEEQMAMFRERGLNPARAFWEAIVPTGEMRTLASGKVVHLCRIVKRSESLEPNDINDDSEASVRGSRAQETHMRERLRGKFNDEGRLEILNPNLAVGIGDVESFRREF